MLPLEMSAEIMAREAVTRQDIEFFLSQKRMTGHSHVRAREAKLSAIPFDYLSSLTTHSGPFLPRSLDTSRSFIAQSEAQLNEICP